MPADRISLARVAIDGDRERFVAWHQGRNISGQRFSADVAELAADLASRPEQRYALYYETTYPFAVLLFALWYAGKQVWIPGNNRPATAENLLRQGCRLMGEWPGQDNHPESGARFPKPLAALDLTNTRLTLFTSGTGGEPKAIVKSLLQLQREVEVLEQQWGARLGRSSAVATVSHQHIYGLLFKLLWPLAAGRSFHSPMYLSPGPMLKALGSAPGYWVASPAHLKRLDDLSEWHEIARLTAIFSSGGPLSGDASRRIERCSGQQVFEIFGSSETGGIGWRCPSIEAPWTPFAGIALTQQGDRCRLQSPFLPAPGVRLLDDRVEVLGDGRFILAGRIDRIVKVEEKRLSLDELERRLQSSDWVEEVHCLLLSGARERVAAVIVPAESGRMLLRQEGRTAMIRQLRKHLMQAFETVVLPRKWLFMDALPMTPQGKIDKALLLRLLRLDAAKFPQLLFCRWQGSKVQLDLRVRPQLVYFDGHFPGHPILPGAAQLAWVDNYGKLFFPIEQPFLTMEVIKFKKIIRPGALITMTLEWKAANAKLYFELDSSDDFHSSGRMVYGVRT